MTDAARFDPASLRLVGITDSLRDGIDGLADRAARAVLGGATMLQLRLADETPRVLVEVARALRRAAPQVPLVVTARVDVALAAGAQGIYLSADDLLPRVVRRFTPPGFIVGFSLGDETEVSHAAGADYVGVGPVFAAVTGQARAALGLERFSELRAIATLPTVAIGGVHSGNIAAVMAAGANGVAVISALLGAPDPTQAARALRSAQDASGR